MVSSYPNFKRLLGLVTLSMLINRFIFYGFRAFFLLYLTFEGKSGLGFSEGKAFDIFGTFEISIYSAFFVMGTFVMSSKRSAINAIIGQALALGGYLSIMMVPSIPIHVPLGIIVIGESLYRIGIFVTLAHNVLAAKKSGFFSFILLFLIIDVGAYLGTKIIAPIWEQMGINIAMIPIFIAGVVNLWLIKKLIPISKKQLSFISEQTNDLSINRIITTIGIIVLIAATWTMNELININLINPKIEDLGEIPIYGGSIKAEFLNSFSESISFIISLLFVGLFAFKQPYRLRPLLGISLILISLGLGFDFLFNYQYNGNNPDFTLHLLGTILITIAQVILSLTIVILIVRWFAPWNLAAIYGLYLTINGLGSKLQYYLIDDKLINLQGHLILLGSAGLLYLILGIFILINNKKFNKQYLDFY